MGEGGEGRRGSATPIASSFGCVHESPLRVTVTSSSLRSKYVLSANSRGSCSCTLLPLAEGRWGQGEVSEQLHAHLEKRLITYPYTQVLTAGHQALIHAVSVLP